MPTTPARIIGSMAKYQDLRQFMAELERDGLLHRIRHPVSVVHEMTEIHRRVLDTHGPALLFENPVDPGGHPCRMPVLVNVFGTKERIARGLGVRAGELGKLGELLAFLRQPDAPDNLRSALDALPAAKAALAMGTRKIARAPVHARKLLGDEIDLGKLPVQWCWPDEPAPLVTWPLVITRSPDDPGDINVGIYRMQVLGPNRLIVRWLAHRGGARHHKLWAGRGEHMPVAVAIGADPATILSAVMPVPETMNELAFAGVLRGKKTRVAHAQTVSLGVPADAEIVIEGYVSPYETAPEGPYGDHTGYYNAVADFPIMTVSAITMRRSPIYLSTYTGRSPDEPSRLGEVMTEVFTPIVKKQFPEVRDYWLPPEACSYRAMVVSIDKRYPGQARRLMMGLWSVLPQFIYTKLIIVVDADINVRDWADVMWAISTRFDSSRDLMLVDNTPIDYLDFASLREGLGGKMGIDATTKIGTESDREWGHILQMSPDVIAHVDTIWAELGLSRSTEEV